MTQVLKVFFQEESSLGYRKKLFATRAKTEHGEVVLTAPTLEALLAFCQQSAGDCSLDSSEVN